MGRPTKYNPDMCERVIEFGRQGMSKAEIACELDVARSTMALWEREYPDFSDALQRAKDYELAWWEKTARLGVNNGSQVNAGLWKQAVSGRFPNEPYRERAEISGANGGAVLTRIELVGVSPSDDSTA